MDRIFDLENLGSPVAGGKHKRRRADSKTWWIAWWSWSEICQGLLLLSRVVSWSLLIAPCGLLVYSWLSWSFWSL